MENLSLRAKIALISLGFIMVICPWLGGGLLPDFSYQIILILTALSLFLFGMVFIVEKKPFISEKKPFIFIFLFLFIAAGIISSIFSIRSYNSWSESIMWLAGIALFIILSQLNTEGILKKFAWFFISMGSIVSVAGFIIFFLNDESRLESVLANPNLLSGYLIGIWPIVLTLLFLPSAKKVKILLYILNIIIASAFVLTVSYSAWAAIVPIILFLIIYFRKKIFNIKFMAWVLLACLLIFTNVSLLRYYNTNSATEGVAVYKSITKTHASYSGSQRLDFLKNGLNIFTEHPLTGIGLNNLKLAYQKKQTNIVETPRSTHNNYLDISIEMGILGIIGFGGFILFLFIKFLKLKNNLYCLGLFLGWMGLLIYGAVDFAWQIKIIIVHFFIMSGLLYGCYLRQNKNSVVATLESPLLRNASRKIIIFIFIILSLTFFARGVQIFLNNNNKIQGERYQELSEYRTAISYYNQAYRYDKDPDLLAKIGILQYTEENYAEAEKTTLLWIEKSPHDPSAYQLLGRIFKAQNKLVEANEQFNKALILAPYTNSEIKLDSIETNFMLGNYKIVVDEVDPYIIIYSVNRPEPTWEIKNSISINLTKMLDYQGDAYLALGDKEKARDSWQRALLERPSYYIAQQKIDKLDNL
ncbi:MAG: O-antigen ligase family protein [Patescibacteria group bacterium]|jgi:O-antigen ligase/predicted negative regulator of RcsB-dependent stress response